MDPAHFYIYLTLGNSKKNVRKGAGPQLMASVIPFPNIEQE